MKIKIRKISKISLCHHHYSFSGGSKHNDVNDHDYTPMGKTIPQSRQFAMTRVIEGNS